MEIIKRNTTEFSDVEKLIEQYRLKPERKKLIRLYALKPTEKLDKKIAINDLKEDAAVLYDMHYRDIIDHFADKSKKLFREGRQPFYYFKSSSSSDWLMLPFEFTGKLKKKLFPLKKVE